MLYILVALIGLPLDLLLKKLGYPDVLKGRGDNKPLSKAMNRGFRCGIITLVVLVLLILIFLP